MKKLLLFLPALGIINSTIAQTNTFTLTYNFAQVSSTTTPCTGTLDPTPTPTAIGLTSGSFIAVGTNTCPSTTGYFSFAGWGLGATNGDDITFNGSLDPSKYYEITLTPQTNYEISIDSIRFKALRSGTGPRFWSVRHSINGFASNITAVSSNSNVSVVNTGTDTNAFFWNTDTYSSTIIQCCFNVYPSLTQIITPVSFRWFAWNAEGNTGTFRIDDVNIYGSATLTTGVVKITHNINSHFILSPNPTSGGIVYLIPQNIKDVSFVEILDALGSTVYRNTKIDNSNKISINLDNFPAGIYFVRLGTPQNFYLEKLVINK